MSEPHDQGPGFHHVPRPEGGRRRGPVEPFPLEVLPEPVAEMVRAVASSRCIAADVPAAAALAACSSAIGMSRIAYDSFADWTEPPIIWLVIIIRSGSRKTIILEDLFSPHKERQQRAAEEFDGKHANYNQEYENWQQRKRRNKTPEVEPKPQAPLLEHIYTSDPTPEALVEILKVTPRGVLVYVDELAHFFGGFGAYSGKAERDRSFYLALFRGIQFKNDRKGSGTTFVTQAAASIVGGIQPHILRGCFDGDSYKSGLASRFLMVDAPPQIKEYRQGPTPEIKARYVAFIQKLFDLKMDPYSRVDGQVGYGSLKVPLSEEARDLLRGFVPDWSEQSLLESADIEAAMSKLEGYAIRFALVLRVCREVEGDVHPEDPISRSDLEKGIRLARWFRDRALSIYDELKTTEEETPRSSLLARAEVIRRRFGGAVTVREWTKFNSRRTAEDAEAELAELVAAGLATWRERPPGPKGGRPTQECALVDPGQAADGTEPDGGEVSGCGLRGAPADVRDENDPHGAENGGGEGGDAQGCTPKPPEVDFYPELVLRRWDPLVLARDRPGSASDAGEGGGGPGHVRYPPAPRNPKPETPAGRSGRGFWGGWDPGLHPETPTLRGRARFLRPGVPGRRPTGNGSPPPRKDGYDRRPRAALVGPCLENWREPPEGDRW